MVFRLVQTRFRLVQTRFRLVQTEVWTRFKLVQTGSDTVQTRIRHGSDWFRHGSDWFRHGSDWFRLVETRPVQQFRLDTVQTRFRLVQTRLVDWLRHGSDWFRHGSDDCFRRFRVQTGSDTVQTGSDTVHRSDWFRLVRFLYLLRGVPN